MISIVKIRKVTINFSSLEKSETQKERWELSDNKF